MRTWFTETCQFSFLTYADELKPPPPRSKHWYLFKVEAGSTQCLDVSQLKLAVRLQLLRGFPGFTLNILDPRLHFVPLAQIGVAFGGIRSNLRRNIFQIRDVQKFGQT